jgi:hypothetical protein
MSGSNPLLRKFVERATEKSFDKGLLWGSCLGAFVTHFYKEDQYKKLQKRYYALKEKTIEDHYFKQ